MDELTERAVKAARAREKLKKFQAQKNGGITTPTPPSSTPTPISPPMLSASLLFPDNPTSFDFLPQLQRNQPPPRPPPAVVPPPPTPPPAPIIKAAPIVRKLESPTSEGNTIALLVSDKAGLVGRVRELEILLEETEKEGLSATRGLEGRIGTSEMELARLNQANLSLRDEVNAAKQLQTNLKRESELAQRTVVDLATQLAAQSTNLQDLNAQLSELHSSTTLSDIENKLRSKSAHADALELELSKARALSSKFRNDNALLEEELLDAATMGENLAQEMKEITLAHEDSDSRMETLDRELDAVSKARSTVQAQLSTSLANHQALLEDHKSLQSKSATLQSDLTTANARLSTLEESSGSTIARRDDLLKENEGLMGSLDELRTQFVAVTNEKVALSDKNELVNRTLRERETELRAAAVAMEQAEKAKVELSTLRAELERVVLEKVAVEAEATAMRASTVELEEHLVVARSSGTEQHSRVAQLEDALAAARKESTDAMIARDEQSALVTSHLATIAEHEAKLEEARLATAEQLHQVELLSNQLEMLKVKHTDSTARLDQIKASLVAREAEHQTLLDTHSALQSEFSTTIESLRSADTALELSNNAQGSLIARIVKLESDLSTTAQQHSTQISDINATSQEKLEGQSNRADRAEAELSNSVEEVERLSEIVDGLENELRDAGESVEASEALRAELETTRTEMETVREAREEAELALQKLSRMVDEDLAERTAEVDRTRSQLESTEERLNSTTSNLDRITLAHADLLSTNSSLVASLEELRSSVATLNDSQSSEAERTAALSAAAAASVESDATLRLELESLRKKVLEAETARRAAETKLVENVSLVQERDFALERRRKESEDATQEMADLQDRLRASDAADAETNGAEGSDAEFMALQVELANTKEQMGASARAMGELQQLHTRTQKDLASKESELQQLRLRSPTSAPPPPAPLASTKSNAKGRSSSPYDQEYLDSIQTQHALDLSTARTQIRSLEQRVFDEQDSIHQFMKANGDLKSQISSLVDLLDTEREKTQRKERELEVLREAERYRLATDLEQDGRIIPPPPRSLPRSKGGPNAVVSPTRGSAFVPPIPAPLSPRESFLSPPLQRTPASPSIASISQPRFSTEPSNATKAQRHARRESLSLLKTRMEDELGAELGSGAPATTPILGEDVIYCSCCHGDDMYVV